MAKHVNQSFLKGKILSISIKLWTANLFYYKKTALYIFPFYQIITLHGG